MSVVSFTKRGVHSELASNRTTRSAALPSGKSGTSLVDTIERDLRGLALDRPFGLACVQNPQDRDAVAQLIAQRYSWRGYTVDAKTLFHSSADEMTFVAYQDGAIIGTLTLAFDSARGLSADELYKDEIDWHRRQSARCCELTRFALAPSVHSKEVFASLFHLSFIVGRLIRRVSDVFIEVNPRHASFYERMLGLEQLGGERICKRVDAPAVLLRGDLSYIEEQIREHGGSPYKKGQSLYTYFFSAEEEENILRQLRGLQ